MNTYFYRSFLKRVRSHLGEPAHLTGPDRLHINNNSNNSNWEKTIDLLILPAMKQATHLVKLLEKNHKKQGKVKVDVS